MFAIGRDGAAEPITSFFVGAGGELSSSAQFTLFLFKIFIKAPISRGQKTKRSYLPEFLVPESIAPSPTYLIGACRPAQVGQRLRLDRFPALLDRGALHSTNRWRLRSFLRCPAHSERCDSRRNPGPSEQRGRPCERARAGAIFSPRGARRRSAQAAPPTLQRLPALPLNILVIRRPTR
jgi:hypothetical protein